ncbi:POK6 protein, partial [Bombycilla garrulus]|nr:POK6 protein [Bombycilla garrulus]
VDHETGIAHSSTGQAAVERANHTLKDYLARQKQDGHNDTCSRLNKVLFILNYLFLSEDGEEPAVVFDHTTIKEGRPQAIPGLYAYHKNMQTGIWE